MSEKVIWKYELTSPIASISMPQGATLLSVGEQDKAIVLWALVDPAGYGCTRRVGAISTGTKFNDTSGEYIGTVTVGKIVWHVFDFGEYA